MLRKILFTIAIAATVAAQDGPPLQEQPTPFTVWLDFPSLRKSDTDDPSLPIWFESFQHIGVPAAGDEPPKSIYRLRLRRLPTLQREMLLRVFFDDLPEMQPVVTAWSETGRESFRSKPLGTGIGLPTHESVIVPLDAADYLDIMVAGNGTSIRGALASSLKDVAIRQAMDFHGLPDMLDPFGAAPSFTPAVEDSKLYGRVKATLDLGVVRFSDDGDTGAAWHFDLAAAPLAAIVTFDILNADLAALPIVSVGENAPVTASVTWPDLADPGYRGESRGSEPGIRFQYTGWLRAQAVIPAGQLRAGLNKVTVELSDASGPIAVRNVELQLKQNWKHFDYILTPSKP